MLHFEWLRSEGLVASLSDLKYSFFHILRANAAFMIGEKLSSAKMAKLPPAITEMVHKLKQQSLEIVDEATAAELIILSALEKQKLLHHI